MIEDREPTKKFMSVLSIISALVTVFLLSSSAKADGLTLRTQKEEALPIS